MALQCDELPARRQRHALPDECASCQCRRLRRGRDKRLRRRHERRGNANRCAFAAVVDFAANLAGGLGRTDHFLHGSRQGTEPSSCQWRKNGNDVPGATGFTLALSNVDASFAGSYRAVVSNAVSLTTSTNATLSVVPVIVWGMTNNPQLSVSAAVPAMATNVAGDCGGLHCGWLALPGTAGGRKPG